MNEKSASGIEIYNSRGAMLSVQAISEQIGENPELQSRFEAVRVAHAEAEQAAADEIAAQDAVKTALADLADAENYLRTKYAPQSFLSLWKDAKESRRRDLGLVS